MIYVVCVVLYARGPGQNPSDLGLGRFATDLSHACVVVSYDKSYEGRSQRARRESGQEPHFEEWCVCVYVREGLLEEVIFKLRLTPMPNLSSVLNSINTFHGKLGRMQLRFL